MANRAVVQSGKQGQQLVLHTQTGDTELNEGLLTQLAGFKPIGKVYGAETTAAHEFMGVVEDYLRVIGYDRLKLLKTPADVANLLSSQLPVRDALAKLLFKRATGVKGGTAVIIFNILEDDFVAPILRALIQENSHKVLADDLESGAKLPRFEIAFEAVKKTPKQEPQPALPKGGTQAKS